MLWFDSVPGCGFLFFFDDKVGSGCAGGDLYPVWNVRGDVSDVSGVEDDFLSALNAGAADLSWSSDAVCLHGASGDEGDGALFDDHLVGPLLVEFSVAGVDADDEEGFAGAEVVEGVVGYAGWAGLGGGEQLGFALLQVGGGVDDGVCGLAECGKGGGESEGKEDARFHAASFFAISE